MAEAKAKTEKAQKEERSAHKGKAPEKHVPRLKERYFKEIVPALVKEFDFQNNMQAPRLEKIVVNVGVGEANQNPKALDGAQADLAIITGQKPVIRRAKKSVAGFKLRANMPVGVKVTLRGNRMYEFLDRLLSAALPRIRDFRGLSPKSFDGKGNYTFGVTEQLIFPEIDYDKIDAVRGMDISIVTNAKNDEEAYALLKHLGFPFRER